MTARKSSSDYTTYVAMLRGINVGGKHMLPMKQLAEIFAAAQCMDVKTYLQSGNVVFITTPKTEPGLAAALEKKIADRFGFAAPVILRSGGQMAKVVRDNPFIKAGLPEQALHVYFLSNLPGADAVAGLDLNRSAGDAYQVSGQEIYAHLPQGMSRTKLTNAYFDSRLSTVCTARNWATVLKLAEMTQA